jgi:hypothetical protein
VKLLGRNQSQHFGWQAHAQLLFVPRPLQLHPDRQPE